MEGLSSVKWKAEKVVGESGLCVVWISMEEKKKERACYGYALCLIKISEQKGRWSIKHKEE